MTSQAQKAVLLDFHSSSSPSSSTSHSDHPHPSSPPADSKTTDYVHISELLHNHPQTSDVTHLYILTPTSPTDASEVTESLESREHQAVQLHVVPAESRVASFYRAKQNLDSLQLTNITLMCFARQKRFWMYVGQLLFTPLHEWEMKVVEFPLWSNMVIVDQTKETIRFIDDRTTPPHTSIDDVDRNLTLPTTQDTLFNMAQIEETQDHSKYTSQLNTKNNNSDTDDSKSLTQDTFRKKPHEHDTQSSDDSSFGARSSDGSRRTTDSSQGSALDVDSPEEDECTEDSVRTEIRGFLKTLPSLLGLPEVERSCVLPGEDQGFVHGYSTRRGGVTSVGTLCAMNLVYTDKKPDPRLVVEENLRRLALAGGFDPHTFHIVRVEHGHRVWTVGEEEEDPPPKFDALVTNRRGVTIAAAGADCPPLLFADPVAMAIGAAHAGWRGSVGRIAQHVVNTMEERFGSRPEDIRVAIGPGLRLGCFRVLREEGKMFTGVHPSCQVDSVEAFCHVVNKVEGLGRGELLGSFQCCEIEGVHHDEVHFCGMPAVSEQEKTYKQINCEDKPEIPLPVNQTTERDSTYIRSDVDQNSLVQTLPKQCLEELRVAQVHPEKLKNRTERQRRSSDQHWTFVDLQMTNYHVLLQAGVKAEHIDTLTSHCTRCNPDLYFSYERDGFPFGNQIGFITMPSRLAP